MTDTTTTRTWTIAEDYTGGRIDIELSAATPDEALDQYAERMSYVDYGDEDTADEIEVRIWTWDDEDDEVSRTVTLRRDA